MTMKFSWPVKEGISCGGVRIRPDKILETGIRTIDILNPVAEGGTGFIPGPFGCGKTVIQHALSTHAAADIIVVVACGERANEVVELFTEFPEMIDPRTGRSVMERTVIICNTSNMPVAAREASVYTGMTIAEYYRQMGLRVLLLADSTSRWAQALREMSNRLEELPGPDAFPVDLTSIISEYYARSGVIELTGGERGSVTFIGTVSPAGGNLREPVTEATRKAARCFWALSQDRSDAKRYPAIDPVESYSKYLEYPECVSSLSLLHGPDWLFMVNDIKDMLRRGREAWDHINILGDDGVPLSYHRDYHISEFIDAVLLQQDAFDVVDRATPLDRQRYVVVLIHRIAVLPFVFESFSDIGMFFRKLIHILRAMNYTVFGSKEFADAEHACIELCDTRTAKRR